MDICLVIFLLRTNVFEKLDTTFETWVISWGILANITQILWNEYHNHVIASGTTWPTTKLIYPPSGILIEGAGRATNITFDVSGEPFPEERKWYKDGAEITAFNNMK